MVYFLAVGRISPGRFQNFAVCHEFCNRLLVHTFDFLYEDTHSRWQNSQKQDICKISNAFRRNSNFNNFQGVGGEGHAPGPPVLQNAHPHSAPSLTFECTPWSLAGLHRYNRHRRADSYIGWWCQSITNANSKTWCPSKNMWNMSSLSPYFPFPRQEPEKQWRGTHWWRVRGSGDDRVRRILKWLPSIWGLHQPFLSKLKCDGRYHLQNKSLIRIHRAPTCGLFVEFPLSSPSPLHSELEPVPDWLSAKVWLTIVTIATLRLTLIA